MEVYKLSRQYRDSRGIEVIICRLRAESYDAAIKIAEHIEVLPGVFGDDVVEPNAPMVILQRDDT